MLWLNDKEVQFKTFPNNETMLVTEGIAENHHTVNEVRFKYEDDRDLIKLMFLKRYLDDLGFDYVDLLVYYMPYSRMDRTQGGSAFTLKYVSEFINGLNFSEVRIIEPHSDVTPALVDRSTVHMINERLVKVVMDKVDFDKEVDYLVFPDAGAQKRYHSLDNYPHFVGFKHRDFDTGRIKSLELVGDGNQAGRKAIIVDDLSSYGGTFMLTGQALKDRGFKEVYLLVAHAENVIFRGKIFEEGSPIDKVFTTNSILTTPVAWADAKHKDKIEIFPLEDVVE